jgi:hypothetical protein
MSNDYKFSMTFNEYKFSIAFPYDAAELEVSRHRTGGVWITIIDDCGDEHLQEMTPAQAKSLAVALEIAAEWPSNQEVLERPETDDMGDLCQKNA